MVRILLIINDHLDKWKIKYGKNGLSTFAFHCFFKCRQKFVSNLYALKNWFLKYGWRATKKSRLKDWHLEMDHWRESNYHCDLVSHMHHVRHRRLIPLLMKPRVKWNLNLMNLDISIWQNPLTWRTIFSASLIVKSVEKNPDVINPHYGGYILSVCWPFALSWSNWMIWSNLK